MDLWNFCSEHEEQVSQITQIMKQQHFSSMEEDELFHQELYTMFYNISISDPEHWSEICSMISFCQDEMEEFATTFLNEEEENDELPSCPILENRNPSIDKSPVTPSFSTQPCTIDVTNQYDQFYWKEAFSILLSKLLRLNSICFFTQLQVTTQKKNRTKNSNVVPFAWLRFKFKHLSS